MIGLRSEIGGPEFERHLTSFSPSHPCLSSSIPSATGQPRSTAPPQTGATSGSNLLKTEFRPKKSLVQSPPLPITHHVIDTLCISPLPYRFWLLISNLLIHEGRLIPHKLRKKRVFYLSQIPYQLFHMT